MRNTKTAQNRPGALGARTIILLALVTSLLVLLGQVREAQATHGGTFGFNDDAITVDEGETALLPIAFSNRDTSEHVNLFLDISLQTAETSDIANAGSDICYPIDGAISNPFTVGIGTLADADTADEQFTVTLVINAAGCPETHAVAGGQQTITVTINDSGTAQDGNTFEFNATSSTGEEGDVITLNVTRNGDLNGAASVDCDVTGGTAEGTDYDVIDGTANFGDNDSTGSCQIELLADADVDLSETIVVDLTNPNNGEVGTPDTHTITILDPDAEIVQFSSATYTVDEDGGTASFTITRTNPSGTDEFTCSTEEIVGEADAGEDYTAQADAISFTSSATTRTCTVPILDDDDTEGPETFRLVLVQVSGDATLGAIDEAIVTIDDDEVQQTFAFEFATYTVNEAAGTVTISIVRSSSEGTGSVGWDITGGTATAGVDYTDASGTESFSAGEVEETFTIVILQTATVEGNETIIVTLEDPVNGDIGTPSQTTITITEAGIPTITSVSPTTLNVAGGQSVVITGTNLTAATAVTFCGVNATSFVVNSSTQITAVAPARAAGACDVRVTTPGGTTANTAADNVTYAATTTITYSLNVRWSLIAWLGRNNASIPSALAGTLALSTSLNQTTPNNISSVVTAIATWDNPTQRYLFWFPGGASVPGANDITQFKYGTPYWIAVTQNVNWVVVQGP